MDEHPDTARITTLENDVGGLKTDMARVTATTEQSSISIAAMAGKMDRALASSGSLEATRGMIPTKYVWMTLAAAVSIAGVFLTVFQIYSGSVSDDFEDVRKEFAAAVEFEDKIIQERLDHAATRERLEFEKDRIRIIRLESEQDKIDQSIVDIRSSRFDDKKGAKLTEDQVALRDRIAELEVEAAVNETKIEDNGEASDRLDRVEDEQRRRTPLIERIE